MTHEELYNDMQEKKQLYDRLSMAPNTGGYEQYVAYEKAKREYFDAYLKLNSQ